MTKSGFSRIGSVWQSLHADVGYAIPGLRADANPLFRKHSKTAGPPNQQLSNNQNLQLAMEVLANISLHKLAVDVLHIRLIAGMQILFRGNGCGGGHAI